MKGSDIKRYLETNGIKQSFVSERTGIPALILNMMINDNRKIEANEYMKIYDATFPLCQGVRVVFFSADYGWNFVS